VAAGRRREPARVGRYGWVHRQGGQLGAAEQLAAERLGAAEQDAELGVHG
jgi:hypothetical protein